MRYRLIELSTRVRALRALLLAVVTVVSAFSPTAAAGRPDIAPRRDTLLNGLRVVSVSKPSSRVAVTCVVRAGSMFDPAGKSGLANITAGLLTRGAGPWDTNRVKAELDDAGAVLSVETTWDAAVIEIEGPSRGLPTMLQIVGLMVTQPRFAPDEVQRVKEAALERVRVDLGDAAAVADRRFAGALYGAHTYGRAVWGEADSIASITPGDVQVFFEKFYAANAATLAVCGSSPAGQLDALVRSSFGRWQKKDVVPATFLPPAPATVTKVVVVDAPQLQTAVVRAGFMAPGRSDANTASVAVLAERLQKHLESRLGGATDLAVRHELRMLQSPFVVGYAVPVDRLGATLSGVVSGLSSLTATPQSANGTARLYFTKMSENCSGEARTLALEEFFLAQKLAPDPVNYKVDEAQVANAARTVLKPSALTVVIVGNAAAITKALDGKYSVEVAPGS
jgi:zinc protease